MNLGAGVNSIEVLRDWYAALAEFRTEGQNALTAATLSVRRAVDWLNDQEKHWARTIRRCEDDVVQAQAELRARRMATFSGERPDCALQELNLRKAKQRLEFAEDRLDATRRWAKRLPAEICDTYDAPTRQLNFFLEGDLARGLALL